MSSLPVLFFYQVFSTSEEGSKPARVILASVVFFIRFSQLVKKEANLLVSSLPVLFFYQFFSTSEEGSKPDCVILASVVFYQVFSTGEGSKLVKKEANLIVSSLPVLFFIRFSQLVKKEANLLVSCLASVVFLLVFLNQ